MSDFIPQELQIEILKRLSIEDLIRFRTVCKSWYALITNPSFISLHTQTHASSNKSNLLLVRSRSVSSQNETFSIRFDDDSFQEYKSLNSPFKNGFFRVIGSFNGVVCLSDDVNLLITLWNPSIRKCLTLPQPVLYDCPNYSIGFSFCEATSDFKVVRVCNLELDEAVLGLEVFELGKGYWRRVDVKGFPYIVHPHCPQAYLNGVVHWTGSSQTLRTDGFFNMIVSFDIGTEELGVIEMPAFVAHDDWDWQPGFRVSVLQGSLSIIHHVSSEFFGHLCDIWVMKEYGKPESWTHTFTISLNVGLEGAFGFLRNGHAVVTENTNPWNAFERWEGNKLASYDPQSKKVKHLGINGDAKAFYVDNFVETLALLGVPGARSAEEED